MPCGYSRRSSSRRPGSSSAARRSSSPRAWLGTAATGNASARAHRGSGRCGTCPARPPPYPPGSSGTRPPTHRSTVRGQASVLDGMPPGTRRHRRHTVVPWFSSAPCPLVRSRHRAVGGGQHLPRHGAAPGSGGVRSPRGRSASPGRRRSSAARPSADRAERAQR